MEGAPKISAIILAFNEESLIERIIYEIKKQEYSGQVETILADGNSTDRTVDVAKSHGIKVCTSEKKGKGIQMNSAAKKATGEILFFLHADMQLQKNTFSAIAIAIRRGFSGGGFSNVFDSENEKIKKLGTRMNLRFFDKREQSDKGSFYGDNGIFVKKIVFENLNGFKEIPIMEDYDFSKRLNQKYKTIKINDPQIMVSARRHIKAGFTKTRLQWILIRKLFKLGVSPHTLSKAYKDIR